MTRKILMVLAFISFTYLSYGQLNPAADESAEDLVKTLPSKLFLQFANSIKPASYQSAFSSQKTSFLNEAKDVNDPLGLSKNVLVLASNLKTGMFKEGSDLKNLKTKAENAKTMEQAATALKYLETSLKTEAMSDTWKFQSSNWNTEIKQLK